MITCKLCDFEENPSDGLFCRNCLEAIKSEKREKKYSRLMFDTLRENALLYIDDECTSEYFYQFLQKLQEQLKERLSNIEDLKISPDIMDEVDNERNISLRGHRTFIEVTEEFLNIIDEEMDDEDDLFDVVTYNLERAEKANHDLNKAIDIIIEKEGNENIFINTDLV